MFVIYMLYHVFLGFSMVLRNSYYPFPQEQGIQGYQNQYAPQAPVAPMFHTHYVNNAAGIPTFQNQCFSSAYQHSSANLNQLPLSTKLINKRFCLYMVQAQMFLQSTMSLKTLRHLGKILCHRMSTC